MTQLIVRVGNWFCWCKKAITSSIVPGDSFTTHYGIFGVIFSCVHTSIGQLHAQFEDLLTAIVHRCNEL